MPLGETETKMIKVVVDRFMNLKESTNRKDLVTKFRSYHAVDQLVSIGALRALDSDGNLAPLCLGVDYASDPDSLERAKTSVEIVLQALQNLYDVTPPRMQVTARDVLTHANSMYAGIAPEVIERGLYFLQEFPVLDSYGATGGQPRSRKVSSMEWMVVSERIVTLDVKNAWDEHIRNCRITQEGITEAVQTTQPAEAKPPTNQAVLVLISHSSNDADLALALIELLKAGLGLLSHQIRCSSVDGYRLPVGVNTEAKLREEVRLAKVVIGLITPSSLSSAFVMFELGARWGAELFVAPLLAGVGPDELSGPLPLLNALSSSNEAQLHQLLADISVQLALPLQNAASYLRYVSEVKRLSENIHSAAVGKTGDAPRPNVGCLRPELITITYDEEADVWSRGNEGFSAAVVAFSNEPRPPTKILAVDGLTARLTYFKGDGIEEVRRIDTGCWVGEAYGFIRLGVGRIVYLIAAFRNGGGDAAVVTNPRHSAARYSEDHSVVDSLPAGNYELKVDLAAGDHGEYAETYWFQLEVGEQLKIRRLNQRPAD